VKVKTDCAARFQKSFDMIIRLIYI